MLICYNFLKERFYTERMCGIVLQGFFDMTLGYCNPSVCVCVLLTCGSCSTYTHAHAYKCPQMFTQVSHSQRSSMMSCQSDLHEQNGDGEECVRGDGCTCAVCGFPAAVLQGVIPNIARVYSCVLVTGLILACFGA